MKDPDTSDTDDQAAQKGIPRCCGILALICALLVLLYVAYVSSGPDYAGACFRMGQISRVTTQPEVWDQVEWHGTIIKRTGDPKSFRRIIEALRTVRVSRVPAIRNQPVLLSLYFCQRGEHGMQQILYLNGRFLRYRRATELIEEVMAEKRKDQRATRPG